jgi:hypothetical protein
MSASVSNCAHSATTIGAANASGITSKHQAWGPSLRDLPYEFYASAPSPTSPAESPTLPSLSSGILWVIPARGLLKCF